MTNFVHIVSGDSASGSLKRALATDNIQDNEVISLLEDLSIGPIQNLETTKGKLNRQKWWGKISQWITEDDFEIECSKIDKIKELSSQKNLCFWLGKDTINKLAFAKLTFELKDTKANIYIMDYPSNHFRFPTGDRQFFNIRFLPPEQLVLLKKHIRKALPEDLSKLILLWKQALNQESILRVINENNEVQHVVESFYDEYLLKCCSPEMQNAGKIIGCAIGEVSKTDDIGSEYLSWRLKKLAESNRLTYSGSLSKIRDYKVKLNP